MKPIIRFAARLYPQRWRERYGEEFEALLDDTGADVRTTFNVFQGALLMQVQQRKKIGVALLLALAALSVASWRVGQRPYISPGSHLVLHMDSTPAALVGLSIMLAAAIGGLACFVLRERRKLRAAACVGRASAGVFILYLAAVVLASLLTPRTIVSTGDSYCYDTWCIGVQRVNAAPRGRNILYKADVLIFSDANRVTARREEDFLYAIDDRGRRFPLVQDPSHVRLDVTVRPGESVQTSLAFEAPANARKLYLTGDYAVMPWVPLCVGSDISPFHRRTLLRIL